MSAERISKHERTMIDPRPTLDAPDDDPYLWLEEINSERSLAWIEPQFHFPSLEFGADFQEISAKTHRAVLAYDPPLPMQKDFIQIFLSGKSANHGELGQPVLARNASCRVMPARVIFCG